MARCDACPVSEGLTCYEQPGMCRRAARPGEEAFRAALVKHAEARCGGMPGGVVAPTPAEAIVLLARMKACPHWVKRADCGCGLNECLAGKGREGLVSHQECFACLSAGTTE